MRSPFSPSSPSPDSLPGGFVGVDVFFVISGFVITRVLCREHERHARIDFAAFYVVAKTGIGAIAFAANWVIATTTDGYFDAPAATNPLLHTWSLSVEEQFYPVFPALLAPGWLLGRRSALLVSLVTAASLLGALVGVNPFVHGRLLGFYSPMTRAWEFGAGALLALAAPRIGARARAALTAGGLAGLVASFVVIDGTTAYPGALILVPVGATVLLIAAETRALSPAPLVRGGDWFVLDPSLALAVHRVRDASYRWIESPFRTLRPLLRTRFALVIAAVALRLSQSTPPRTCGMARHGLLLYRDSNHLNANGSLYLARRLVERYPAVATG